MGNDNRKYVVNANGATKNKPLKVLKISLAFAQSRTVHTIPNEISNRMIHETPDFPLEISQDEADLGFERIQIQKMPTVRGPQLRPPPVWVVAKILSSSDMLLKMRNFSTGEIQYSHQRWGYNKEMESREKAHWNPLSTPVEDPSQLLTDISLEIHKECVDEDFTANAFPFVRADLR